MMDCLDAALQATPPIAAQLQSLCEGLAVEVNGGLIFFL
jgi:hypothetical protein